VNAEQAPKSAAEATKLSEQIQVVLAYSPDRLNRKYAYQILLMEVFARHGVGTLFVNSPQGDSAEDQLLVQFQGMIAE
jgi:site-specific DNA recombinase